MSEVKADGNPNYGTDFGNDTTDRIFLLSITEAKKYFSSDEDRQCKGTAVCYAKGAHYEGDGDYIWWWLRTVGSRGNYTAEVFCHGGVSVIGYNVLAEKGCVRPAFWINLGK